MSMPLISVQIGQIDHHRKVTATASTRGLRSGFAVVRALCTTTYLYYQERNNKRILSLICLVAHLAKMQDLLNQSAAHVTVLAVQ